MGVATNGPTYELALQTAVAKTLRVCGCADVMKAPEHNGMFAV